MADNVLESGPPSAKRPKLSSPALSVSASDGNGKYVYFHLHDMWEKCSFFPVQLQRGGVSTTLLQENSGRELNINLVFA